MDKLKLLVIYKPACCCLLAIFPILLGAQERDLFLTLKSAGGAVVYAENDCSFRRASGWGGTITNELCAELVWVKDLVGQDSLACDSVAKGLYAGKIALVRRGVCSFGLKALQAQRAGAVAVLIVNHFDNVADNQCSLTSMDPGAFGAQVTIPVFFACRDLGNILDRAVKKGATQLCFSVRCFYQATAPYHYATPLSQAGFLKHITVRYVNCETTAEEDVEINATFIAPDGIAHTLMVPLAVVKPGQDTLVVFPAYKPKLMEGKHEVIFTNNKHSQIRDTLHRSFYYTKYTYATDNLVLEPLGVGCTDQDLFFPFTQSASLYHTNAQGGKATYATFGIANADSLFVPGDPFANLIVITLYDADTDGDGQTNLSSSNQTFDDLADGIVGQTVYTMNGKEPVDSLLNVPIYDYNHPNVLGVNLKKNHAYYLSIAYDGSAAATGRCFRFSNTLDEYYLGGFFATPLYSGGTLYNSGWQGAEVIQRLRLNGYNPAVKNEPFEASTGVASTLLDPSKITVTPNPANEFIRVELSLKEVSPSVGFTLLNGQGRPVRSATQRNFQSGALQIDAKDLPSGVYLLWIRTAEGGRMEKVMVCH